VAFQYDVVFNGFAVQLTAAEAAQVAGLPGVVDVQPEGTYYLDTDVGPAWIRAPGIWDGSATGLPGTKGEGIVVGIIDSGINTDHPSFADIGGDGYDHTNPLGSGIYKGWCNAGFPGLATCNDKLIGVYSYATSGNNPEDDDGHGSHTASTVAGNVLLGAGLDGPTTTISGNISGVAPHANIIAYDACAGTCPGTALLAAINQAVADGVDVINYSISGGNDPYNDTQSLAFRNAVAAGVFVQTSAGNSGPGAGTTGHNEPWTSAAAATTHNRTIFNDLVSMSGGSTPPANMRGKGFTSGFGPALIVYAGNFGNALCAPGFWAPGTFSGQIVVCDRGIYGRVEKGQAVLNAGGGGYVLANDAPNGNSLTGDAHVLPGVHITYADGVVLKNWLASGSGHTATISGYIVDLSPANGDVVAGFSSRGPNTGLGDILKPDIAAPGVDVWAAVANGGDANPPEFGFISGTSMASPHAAGAAALLRALHPTWTPMQVKSALMMGANPASVRDTDGVTPANPFAMGAGRVDLVGAANAGLLLNESDANFIAANPATGGQPRDLNLASLTEDNCFLSCSWNRTFDVAAGGAWSASYGGPAGMVIAASPANFNAATGGTQGVTISVDVSALPKNQWYFAAVTWSDGPSGAADARMPIAVYASASTDPLVLGKGASVTEAAGGEVYTYTVTVANTSPLAQTFLITDVLPAGTSYVPGSATGGLVYDAANNRLTTSAFLDGLDLAVTASPSPFGYLAPGGPELGSVRNLCTALGSTQCDETAVNISGYNFRFLNVAYSAIRVTSNGWVSPIDPAGNWFLNQQFPDATPPNGVIAPFWTDLDLDGTSGSDPGSGYFYDDVYVDPGDSSNVYFVFGWENAQLYNDPTRKVSAQVWIKQNTDQIWFTYGNITGGLPTGYNGGTDAGGGLTVGAENTAGTVGANYYYQPYAGGSPSGTPPVVGTDLKVNAVLDTATYTYQVMVDSTASGDLIQNVVDAQRVGGQLYQAVSDVQLLPFSYGVQLSADMAQAGPAGTTVIYNMTVTNTGDTTDSFNLEVDSTWPAVVIPSTSGNLNPGASAAFAVHVTIPAGASAGSSDIATVTATSEGAPTVSDSASLTTTAEAPEGYRLYLPGAAQTYLDAQPFRSRKRRTSCRSSRSSPSPASSWLMRSAAASMPASACRASRVCSWVRRPAIS
jgi:uncharacterized repeat protein (TIGR01451 family)